MKRNKTRERPVSKPEFYPHTKQPMIRPKINFAAAAVLFAAVLAVDVGIVFGILFVMSNFSWYSSIEAGVGVQFAVLFAVVACISLILCAKWIVIFGIRIYQRYAPYEVRSACCYIPNCSEYMILAIKKYGLIRGIKKGRDRLRRCGLTEGGEDYP